MWARWASAPRSRWKSRRRRCCCRPRAGIRSQLCKTKRAGTRENRAVWFLRLFALWGGASPWAQNSLRPQALPGMRSPHRHGVILRLIPYRAAVLFSRMPVTGRPLPAVIDQGGTIRTRVGRAGYGLFPSRPRHSVHALRTPPENASPFPDEFRP